MQMMIADKPRMINQAEGCTRVSNNIDQAAPQVSCCLGVPLSIGIDLFSKLVFLGGTVEPKQCALCRAALITREVAFASVEPG